MKYLLSTIFTILFFSTYAQISDSKIQLRNDIHINKNVKSYSVRNMKGIDNFRIDSTLTKVDSSQLDFLKNHKLFDNRELYNSYLKHTLHYGKKPYLKQWIVPVKLFFDENLDASTVNDFKTFLRSFESINNLSISIVDDLESANYYIKIAKKEVSAYTREKLDELDENERNTFPYVKMTYKSFSDNNNKLTSCTLSISPSALREKSLNDNLKKVFFYSLTQFRPNNKTPEGSILNPISTDIKFLTEYDLSLINMHYSHIYNFKVDYHVMKAMEKRHKAIKSKT